MIFSIDNPGISTFPIKYYETDTATERHKHVKNAEFKKIKKLTDFPIQEHCLPKVHFQEERLLLLLQSCSMLMESCMKEEIYVMKKKPLNFSVTEMFKLRIKTNKCRVFSYNISCMPNNNKGKNLSSIASCNRNGKHLHQEVQNVF